MPTIGVYCLLVLCVCASYFASAHVHVEPWRPGLRNVPYYPSPQYKRAGTNYFNFTYTSPSTPAALRTALDYACNDILPSLIQFFGTIYVKVDYSALGSGILGFAKASAHCQGTVSSSNVYFPAPLHDYRRGSDDPNCPSSGNPDYPYDLVASFSDLTNTAAFVWDFSTDANAAIANNAVSFVTVALHEILHGLGFNTLYQQNGSGVIDNFASPKNPSIYDFYMRLGQSSASPIYQSSAVATDLTSANVYFEMTDGGSPTWIKLNCPATWVQGSSVGHYEGDSGLNQLMKPLIFSGTRIYYPGQWALRILRQIGWALQTTALLTELTSTTTSASISTISTQSSSTSSASTASSSTTATSYATSIGPSTTLSATSLSGTTASSTSQVVASSSTTSSLTASVASSTSSTTTASTTALVSSSSSSAVASSSSTATTGQATVSTQAASQASTTQQVTSTSASATAASSASVSSTSATSLTSRSSTASTSTLSITSSTSSTSSASISSTTSTSAGASVPTTAAPTPAPPDASQKKKKFPIVIVAAAIGGGLAVCIALIVLAVIIKKCCCSAEAKARRRPHSRRDWDNFSI